MNLVESHRKTDLCQVRTKLHYHIITEYDSGGKLLWNGVDFVFFDLPGTFNDEGVVHTLSNVDYVFTPIAADKIALESTVSFALVVKEHFVDNPKSDNKGIYLFWNMVDGREKTNLYSAYEKIIGELDIPILKTFVPNTTKYKKEGSDEGVNLFRSTIFPASRSMLRGSRLVELVDEILETVK